MVRAKARFVGGDEGVLIEDFSLSLKRRLREYYPDKEVEQNEFWEHPADAFVEHILSEARWAKNQLHGHSRDIKKDEMRAEHNAVLKCLKTTSEKLRRLSPDFDRLLGVDADPLGCADKIDDLLRYVEASRKLIEDLPKAKTPSEKQHAVAVELAVRVLHVLKEYGIAPNATGDIDLGYTSNAVQILKEIGNDMSLVFSPLTWRDIILEAKRMTPNLQ